jgi:hypothetical protein
MGEAATRGTQVLILAMWAAHANAAAVAASSPTPASMQTLEPWCSCRSGAPGAAAAGA